MSPFYLLAKFGHFVCWKGILEILRSFACIVQQANCIYGCRWLCNLHSFNIYIHLRLYCVPFSPFSPAIVFDLLDFPHASSPRPKWKQQQRRGRYCGWERSPKILTLKLIRENEYTYPERLVDIFVWQTVFIGSSICKYYKNVLFIRSFASLHSKHFVTSQLNRSVSKGSSF